ncbi:ABC-type sugar transport system, permease component [Mesotoga prima MesG1.Ag.4.2]|uniref:ABC-type sugar transport system, permease component n=1 Tax=Mesotoga prima MesG1.Ag.4.2 TaxID=660470 RepID=I2F3G6_9BACT|nr:carbohydrate ABC transporter permease [Mesotoga prima]AFK06469.1 ABC-type sugar transport system, permease component [Mesotoga prima MesG1.Ag.4.2]
MSKRVGRTVKYVILVVGAIVMVFPFFWSFMTSFKDLKEILRDPFSLIPKEFTMKNYVSVFTKVPFARYLLNSTVVALATTFLQLVTACLAAFAFARMRFRGRDVIFYVFLATMMIPQQVVMIPQYLVVMKLNMDNSYLGLILPHAATAISIFFLRQFFLTIPRDLEDAATIDGCGPLRTLVNVFLPLTKPAIATIAVFSFMWSWNNYFWPLLVISEPEMRTVQLGLAMFKSEGGIQWGEFMAATVVATLPIMIAYFIAQRQFVKGITLTGLKG